MGEGGEPQLPSVTLACISFPFCPRWLQDLFPFPLATLPSGGQGDRVAMEVVGAETAGATQAPDCPQEGALVPSQ